MFAFVLVCFPVQYVGLIVRLWIKGFGDIEIQPLAAEFQKSFNTKVLFAKTVGQSHLMPPLLNNILIPFAVGLNIRSFRYPMASKTPSLIKIDPVCLCLLSLPHHEL